ncbi:hypothetical protein BFW87_30245 [Pseudomonas fluorescens]|uniref:Uncharacterized protein n=2 Tax=Pseudomonas fluorescens TaxID=294 RepID=A0A1T2XUQ1_PSEFL|nr:hypothetical protein BFW87_30245 [Pseudomonas fluorescens]
MRFEDLTQPKASGVVTEDLPFYHLAFQGDDNIDKVVKYFTRVVRFSGQESRSDIEEVQVLTTIPSGNDPNENEPYHSGLLGWLDGIPEGGIITPANAAELWWWIYPYVNIRQNDENIIEVDGNPFTHIVSPEQASSKEAYRVQIPPEIIDKITRSGAFGIRMKMRNVMGDEPESRYKYSKPYSLFSELGAGKLPQPVVTQGPDEDEVFEIDLDYEATLDFSVKVYPVRFPKPFPSPRHTCQLYAEITPDGGVTEVLTLGATPDKNQGGESIFLERNFFNDKVGPGKVRFFYKVISGSGKEVGESYSNLIYVIGQQKMMPKPLIKPLTGGLIPHDKDVEFGFPTYQPFAAKNLATAIFRTKGNNNGAYVVSSKQLAATQQNKRIFTSKSLKVLEGKGDLEALYEVDQGNLKPPRTSEIEAARIGEGEAELPALYIDLVKPNYTNFNLDSAELTGYGLIAKILWSGTVPKDEVQISIEGSSPKFSYKYSFEIDASTAGLKLADLEIPIPEDVVLGNVNKIVSARYAVVTKGALPITRHSEVLIFSVGEPVELKTLKLLQATQASIDPTVVLNGGELQATLSKALKGDEFTFNLEGAYGIAQFTKVVAVGSGSTLIKEQVPIDVFAKGLRPGGNNFLLKGWLKRGPFRYDFEPVPLYLKPIQLPALYVGGFKGGSELPLYQMTSVNVIVPAWLFALAGQFFWLNVIYTSNTGVLITEQLAIAREIKASEVGKDISINWPLTSVSKIKDGSVIKLSGSLSYPGIPLLQTATPFGDRTYTVAQLPQTLSFPVLQNAHATQIVTIEPTPFEFNLNFALTVPGMLATDVVVMTVTTQSGVSTQLSAAGNVSGKLLFNFTPHKIIHNCVGGWMQARYALTRNGKVTQSNVLTVYVGAIAFVRNPVAIVNNQSPQTTLDLNRIVGDTKYSMSKWLMAKTGQTVWVEFAVSGRTIPILAGYAIPPVVEANGIAGFGFPRSALTAAPKNTWGYLNIYLAYDGSPNRGRAVLLSQTPYVVSDSFVPSDIKLVNGLSTWVKGSGAADSFLTATGLYMNTTYYGRGESYAGAILIGYFDLTPGHTYYITTSVLNTTAGAPYNQFDPVLSIYVNNVLVHGALTLPKQVWSSLSARFAVPSTGPVPIVIYNNTASGIGNDFFIHAIQVLRVT